MYKMGNDDRMTRYPQALRIVENWAGAGETGTRQTRTF
jgi:hypothetical protein